MRPLSQVLHVMDRRLLSSPHLFTRSSVQVLVWWVSAPSVRVALRKPPGSSRMNTQGRRVLGPHVLWPENSVCGRSTACSGLPTVLSSPDSLASKAVLWAHLVCRWVQPVSWEPHAEQGLWKHLLEHQRDRHVQGQAREGGASVGILFSLECQIIVGVFSFFFGLKSLCGN